MPQPNPVYKPNVNGEAAYDWTYSATTTQMIDTPAGVRHTGYYSTLSGAFGFSLGVKGIYDWTNVSATTLGGDGSRHMAILGSQFRQQPWQALQKSSTLIKNQPAREDQKMVMAVTNDNNFAMLYLPNNDQAWINASAFVGFDCKTSTWTIEWINPRLDSVTTRPCENPTQSVPWHVLKRPPCLDGFNGETGNCDWVVRIRKTSSPSLLAAASVGSGDKAPEVFPRMREDGRGWEVTARWPESAQAVSVSENPALSTHGRMVKLPSAARLTDGSALVAWQAPDLDGDLDGVFARLLGPNGTPVGREFRVNKTTAYGQAHPTIAAMPAGGFIAGWSSYAQDGDLGGIFVRIFNAHPPAASEEIQVNDTTAGHQDFPRIAADLQGNFVVVWTSDNFDGLGSSIYARRFNAQGSPLGPEIRVRTATIDEDHYLTDLSAHRDGGFTVVWSSYDPLETPLGIFSQEFDSSGAAKGEPVLVIGTGPPSGEQP